MPCMRQPAKSILHSELAFHWLKSKSANTAFGDESRREVAKSLQHKLLPEVGLRQAVPLKILKIPSFVQSTLTFQQWLVSPG